MYEVAGRQFRTETDYKLALRDEAEITKLKQTRNLENRAQIEALILDITQNRIRFYTILGEDFVEELRDLAQSISAEKEPKDKKSRKSKHKLPADAKKVSLSDYDETMQKQILSEIKKRDRIRKCIMGACLIVAAGCFAYLGNYYYQTKRLDDYANIQKNLKGDVQSISVKEEPVIHYNEDPEALPDVLSEYQTLYSLNKRLIGWIKIDDTYIDYPVLQTVNNEYYLNHNFDQEEDKNGSIFLDKDCSIYPRSTNLILYGHHMRSGRMFGQLNKYSSEKFYEDHKYIQFDTIYEKGTYEVMYVFRSKIYEESEIVFKYYQFVDALSEAEFDSNMREMAAMSLYDTGVTATYGDELLTLSTCDYYTSYGRFVVVAKKVR
ncbi:MAG: class B sortase [Lachnospiraceae bacterium]